MNEPTIRPYEPEDVESVVAIADLAWRGIHDSYRNIFGQELHDTIFPDADVRKGNEMRGFCENHPELVWVCQLDDRVVGFISFRLECDKAIGTISNNGLMPEYVGRGLGRLMYEAVLAHFRKAGMRHAHVQTGLDEGHAPARRAYKRLGFDIAHEMVNYYMKL